MVETSNAVQLVSAIGATVSSLVALYLVHRRILADRETKLHREDECDVQEALIKKLGLEIRKLKQKANRKP